MRRILYLDRFRFLAVTFAIFAHVLGKHRVAEFDLEAMGLWLTLATRTATPALLIILGIMVAIVYGPRFDEEPARTSARILRRSLQCYAAFVVIVLTGFAAGHQDLATALLALPFLARVSNGTIFQLYVLLLPATIGLLFLRRRLGPAGLVAAVLAVWLASPALGALEGSWPDVLGVPGSLVFGLGGDWGPSAFHGLSLVAFGMLVGATIVATGDVWRNHAIGAIALSLGALIVIAVDVIRIGPQSFAGSIVHFDIYRGNNAIQYYAFGIVSVLLLLAACRIASPFLPDRPLAPIDRIGGLTLTYFLFGEILVLVLPDPPIMRVWPLVLSTAIHIGLAGALTLATHHLLETRRTRAVPSRGAMRSRAQRDLRLGPADMLPVRASERGRARPPTGHAGARERKDD